MGGGELGVEQCGHEDVGDALEPAHPCLLAQHPPRCLQLARRRLRLHLRRRRRLLGKLLRLRLFHLGE